MKKTRYCHLFIVSARPSKCFSGRRCQVGIAEFSMSVVHPLTWVLDESLITSLPGFRSARQGNNIGLGCSWKTRRWPASHHADGQQNQAVYSRASLSIEKTLYRAQQFSLVPTNQPPSASSPPSPRPCCWISFLRDEFIQIEALSKRALSRITCPLDGSVK